MKTGDRCVLDSFAILAYLQDEAGATQVEEFLNAAHRGRIEAWISVVNVGEVLYITERALGLPVAHRAAAIVEQLPVHVVEADRSLTYIAAHVKANYPIACADAFAAALAVAINGQVVTGDPEFANLESLVPIFWIGAD